MATRTFKIWRGNQDGGEFVSYETEITEGMVVLDAIHQIQSESANDMAVRWNCKAGKCGSCSAEVNGMPRLMCMTRMSDLPMDAPVTIEARVEAERMVRESQGFIASFIASARSLRWKIHMDARRNAAEVLGQVGPYEAAPELYQERRVMEIL